MRNQGCEEKMPSDERLCVSTEHESFSAQRNAAQGGIHLNREGEFQFSDP